jgi:hypothetical protein
MVRDLALRELRAARERALKEVTALGLAIEKLESLRVQRDPKPSKPTAVKPQKASLAAQASKEASGTDKSDEKTSHSEQAKVPKVANPPSEELGARPKVSSSAKRKGRRNRVAARFEEGAKANTIGGESVDGRRARAVKDKLSSQSVRSATSGPAESTFDRLGLRGSSVSIETDSRYGSNASLAGEGRSPSGNTRPALPNTKSNGDIAM